MDLEDAGGSIRYLILDRDGKFGAAFDAVLADAGIQVVLTGVRMPRMSAVMERWVGTCRREVLDRMLIWNQAHVGCTRYATSRPTPTRVGHTGRWTRADIFGTHNALHEYETHYNSHRAHQGIEQAAHRQAHCRAFRRTRIRSAPGVEQQVKRRD